MIKAPKWCSDAVPVASKGWVSPKGELMSSSRFTQAQVDEWYGTIETTAEEDIQEVFVAADDKATVEGKWDAAMKDQELDSLSKRELETLGREHGVELDRRQSKKSLISQMKGIITSK